MNGLWNEAAWSTNILSLQDRQIQEIQVPLVHPYPTYVLTYLNFQSMYSNWSHFLYFCCTSFHAPAFRTLIQLSLCFRRYALRRVRDYFKEKKALANPPQIEQEYQYGLQTLEMLKRQARAELFMEAIVIASSQFSVLFSDVVSRGVLTCSIFLSCRLSWTTCTVHRNWL